MCDEISDRSNSTCLFNIRLSFLHIIKINPTFQPYVCRSFLNTRVTEKGNSFMKKIELGRNGRYLSGPDKIRQLCCNLKGCHEVKFS